MRLLYVDDDRINALLFEEALRLAPEFELECAVCAAEALDIAAQWMPEIVVADLHLPDANGLSLLARLRAATARPQLPGFLCTADDAPQVLSAAAAAGFAGVWPKPIDLAAVLADLRRQRRAQQALAASA